MAGKRRVSIGSDYSHVIKRKIERRGRSEFNVIKRSKGKVGGRGREGKESWDDRRDRVWWGKGYTHA